MKGILLEMKFLEFSFTTVVVSTPLVIKLSANCAAMLVTKIEARGGRMET